MANDLHLIKIIDSHNLVILIVGYIITEQIPTVSIDLKPFKRILKQNFVVNTVT
jgi:hypothetical protein